MTTKTKWLDRRIAAPGPYLALCLSPEEFKAAMRDLRCTELPAWIKTPQAHATMHTLDHKNGGIACVVCLRDWEGRDPIEVAGLLIHEAVHIWQAYANHIGERYEGAEQEAYAVQCISQELLAEFARRMA